MKTTVLPAFKFFIALVAFSFAGFFYNKISAQEVTLYRYMYVAPNKADEFIKRETTYWSKVAQKAINKGTLSFWGLFQLVGANGIPNSPNFLFINSYKNIDSVDNVWNATAVFPKVPMSQMEDFSFSTNTSNYFLQDKGWQQAATANEEKDFRYVAMYYHSSSDPDSFTKAEIKVWGPFIKAAMDKNQTGQRGWGNAIVLAPSGPEIKFNSISYDLYPTLSAALLQKWDPAVQFPMEGLTELNKLRTTAPTREIYQVIKVVNQPEKK
jgi:hypothetical protein